MTLETNLFSCQIFDLGYRTVIDGFKSFKIFEKLSNWYFDILHKNDINTNDFIFAIMDNFNVGFLREFIQFESFWIVIGYGILGIFIHHCIHHRW